MSHHILYRKTAMVTGCGRGIGKAIALNLAAAGANIILNDIDTDAVTLVEKEITALGRKAFISVVLVKKRMLKTCLE